MSLDLGQVELFKLFAYLLVMLAGLCIYCFFKFQKDRDYGSFWKRVAFIGVAFQLISFLVHSIFNFSYGVDLGVIINRFWKLQLACFIVITIMWNKHALVYFAYHPIKALNDLLDYHKYQLKKNKKNKK